MKTTVSIEDITKLLDEAETAEQVFWGKQLVISFKLASGFTLLGRAACVDPANFVLEVGQKLARQDAERQLWQLEGYLLQNILSGRLIVAE